MSEAPELPPDLAERGFKLVARAPDRLFAVSVSWGCTGTKVALDEVVREARSLLSYFDWRNDRDKELNL